MTKWLPRPDKDAHPRYLALANAIAADIGTGRLQFSAKLPTQRALAHAVGLSVHTVSNAYAELQRRGLIAGEVGRGTYVTFRSDHGEPRFILGRREKEMIDLSIVRPAIGAIHSDRIAAALAEIAGSGDHAALLACRPIAGFDSHRVAGAHWLNLHGHDVGPEQVMIVNGCAHGILVALATLIKPGDIVATEALTDHGLIALASVLHFRLCGIDFDTDGLRPDAFERACRQGGVKVLVVTPNYSNPTATVMPEERRRQVAEIAQRYDVTIVEDDVFLPLLPEQMPPLAAFDRKRAFYITSLTKSLVSGLRVGYVVAPEMMMPRLETRLRASSWMATPLVSEIAARWIMDGTARLLADWQRAELSARGAILRQHLADHVFCAPPGAPHAFLDLPAAWRPANFATHARLAGVAVTPAEPFVVGENPEPQAIRVTLGAATYQRQLSTGLERLATLFAENPEPAYISF